MSKIANIARLRIGVGSEAENWALEIAHTNDYDFLADIDLPLFDAFDGSINHLRPIIVAFVGEWYLRLFINAARRLPSRQAHLDSSLSAYTNVSKYNEEVYDLLKFCLRVTPMMTRWDREDTGEESKYLDKRARRGPAWCSDSRVDFVMRSLLYAGFRRADAPVIMALLEEMDRTGARVPRPDTDVLSVFTCALIAYRVRVPGRVRGDLNDVFYPTVYTISGPADSEMALTFMVKCAVDLHFGDLNAAIDMLRYVVQHNIVPLDSVKYVMSAHIRSRAWRKVWFARELEGSSVISRMRRRTLDKYKDAIFHEISQLNTQAESAQVVARWFTRNVRIVDWWQSEEQRIAVMGED